MRLVRRFSCAASYVTRLPFAGLVGNADVDELNGLAKYLPAVGLLVGCVLFLLLRLLQLLPADRILSAAVVSVSWLIVTGGIHFDGLMDTADGVFSHRDRSRMLEIMSDSRVGNFGAMTGWCTLLLKFAALCSLPDTHAQAALLVVPTWARWCEAYAIGAFPYLRQSGMGKVWHDTMRFPRDLFLAALVPVAASAAFFPFDTQAVFCASAFTLVSGLAACCYFNNILKGQTGDTYGACVEIAETGGLLFTALLSARLSGL